MNVNKKTDVLYSIMDITPTQAEDLLTLSIKASLQTTIDGMKGFYLPVEPAELETLNNLRQALLSAGIKKGE